MGRLPWCALLALGLLAGCDEGSKKPAATPPFDVVVKVHSDPGTPLAGAQIVYGGTVVGSTNEAGESLLRLQGADGQSFALQVQCPDGFKSPLDPLQVTLRRVDGAAAKPEFQVQCAKMERTVVVAVRAEFGDGLPVTHMGKEVARTDDSGSAHFRLRVAAGSRVRVGLDTSAKPTLKPKNPEQTFEVGQSDAVFVFDPKFEKPKTRSYSGPVKKKPASDLPRKI